MSNDDEYRQYRQDFCLAALRRAHRPMPAGDIAEHIQVLAQAEGHPDACWRNSTPQAIAGALRSLERSGMVVREGERENQRAGRPEPLWAPVQGYDRAAQIPFPPEPVEPGAAPAATLQPPAAPYADLDRSQVMALLGVQDQYLSAVRRFLNDIETIGDRARRELLAAGLEVPGR